MAKGNDPDAIDSPMLSERLIKFINEHQYSFRTALGIMSKPTASELKHVQEKRSGFVLTIGKNRYKILIEVENFDLEE